MIADLLFRAGLQHDSSRTWVHEMASLAFACDYELFVQKLVARGINLDHVWYIASARGLSSKLLEVLPDNGCDPNHSKDTPLGTLSVPLSDGGAELNYFNYSIDGPAGRNFAALFDGFAALSNPQQWRLAAGPPTVYITAGPPVHRNDLYG